MADEDTIKSISLAAILGMSPPPIQKILVEKIMVSCDIKLDKNMLELHEEYWSQAIKNYNSNYLHK